jgi:AcrR family transcriptional regulator
VEAAIGVVRRDGAGALSTRRVARAAGVNPGLLHRYFGSMAVLSARVLDELAVRVAAQFETGADLSPGGMLDCYARVLTHVMVAGRDPRVLQGDNPVVARLVEVGRQRSGFDEADARLLAAHVLVLYLGWVVFGDFVADAAGLGHERAALSVTLREAALDLARAMAVRVGAPGPDAGPEPG